jgi:hypothetical protein
VELIGGDGIERHERLLQLQSSQPNIYSLDQVLYRRAQASIVIKINRILILLLMIAAIGAYPATGELLIPYVSSR